jgi:hypothetical protein
VLKQSLQAGDDPVTAFIASSEAASAGAESTKQMQAKVGSFTCSLHSKEKKHITCLVSLN